MKRLSSDERRGVVAITLVALLIGLLPIAAGHSCGRSAADQEIKTVVFVRDSVAKPEDIPDSVKKKRKKKKDKSKKGGRKGKKKKSGDNKKTPAAPPRDFLDDMIERK